MFCHPEGADFSQRMINVNATVPAQPRINSSGAKRPRVSRRGRSTSAGTGRGTGDRNSQTRRAPPMTSAAAMQTLTKALNKSTDDSKPCSIGSLLSQV